MERTTSRSRQIAKFEFDRHFRSICTSIFSEAPFFEIGGLPSRPVFRRSAWSIAPIPFEIRFDVAEDAGHASMHGYDMSDEYAPLFAVLRARGTEEIVLTTKPSCPRDDLPDIACVPDRDGIRSAIKSGLESVPLPLQVFASSADWGLCSNGEYDGYSVIAGTDAFMADLIAAYGGLARIKRRFWEFNTKFHNWPVADDQRWCKDWEALGWGDVPRSWPAESTDASKS